MYEKEVELVEAADVMPALAMVDVYETLELVHRSGVDGRRSGVERGERVKMKVLRTV